MIELQTRIKLIEIKKLFLNIENPRYEQQDDQIEAIRMIANDQGVKLVKLTKDMIENGLNPSELPIVAPRNGNQNEFIVLEGNRRIAALKLISSPSFLTSIKLPARITNKFKEIYDNNKDNIPEKVVCVVMPYEEARHWIELRHTGENEGKGVVTWDGVQIHRFRGESPVLHVLEDVKESGYLDEATKKKLPKISITNIERIIFTPEARQIIGIDIKGHELIYISPKEDTIARLSMIVYDVANKQINVSDIDTKEDRIKYAQDIASRQLPDKKIKSLVEGSTEEKDSRGKQATSGNKKISTNRNNIIPKNFKIAINQVRINKIYNELQKLDVEKFVNSCAVMLRVFVELSVDDFAQRNKIPLKVIPNIIKSQQRKNNLLQKNMTLKIKLRTVSDWLEKNYKCNKAELKGIRTIISNRDHVLSVDSLHAYVHNKDFNPSASDLKTTWDNIQTFMNVLWAN